MSNKIIIGITGTIGAGKGTVVEYLVKEKDFTHYSVRAWLLEKIREAGLPENRDSMFNVANEFRTKYGSSYVTDQLLAIAMKSKNDCVIESIRTTGEIESLREKGNGDFYLLSVDASPETRYKRIILRKSETDQVSYETFLENEARENTATDPGRQNLKRCIEMADFSVQNDGSKEDLIVLVDEIIKKIKSNR